MAGLLLVMAPGRLPAATLGTVVPIVGRVSDLVYDDRRDLVYLANYSQNRVEVYSVSQRRITTSIATSPQPDSLALSPDRLTLWVASQQASTLSSINLSNNSVNADFPLNARPDAIAVGNDGKVLIYGGTGLLCFDPASQSLLQLQISPPAVPATGTTAATTSALPQGFRAGLMASDDGKVIVGLGVAGTGNSPSMRLFIYEVASGSVVRSRNVSGLSSILSVAPDGSRFMAGPFLFETSSLTILARAGYIPSSTEQLTGGSVFSPDGSTVFASFSTQTPIHPLNTNQPAFSTATTSTSGVIQALTGWSLTPQLGLRLPETITAKVVRSKDGQNLFALSPSGFMAIPIGTLDRLPVIDVDTTNVVLSADICSRAVVTAQVQVRNTGGGRLTFSAASSAGTAVPLSVRQTSSAAPSTPAAAGVAAFRLPPSSL
jgi:DNA-binding beta-propeller fold protein YncE